MAIRLSPKALKKIVAGSVTVAFFFTTVGEPYAQTSFWADRQAARPRASSTLGEGGARQLLSTIVWPKESLNPILGAYRLPSTLGTVVETHTAAPDAPILLHLQDAHGLYGAQFNASKVLDGLFHAGWSGAGAVPVYQEGGAGPANIDWLSAFPFDDIKEKVAHAHLRRGDLTGEEYRAIVASSGTFRLVGVETEDLFKKNLAARHETAKARAAAAAHIGAIQARLASIKAKVYPPALLSLDKPFQAYTNQETSFVEYIQTLAALAPGSFRGGDYPNLDALVRLTKLEAALSPGALSEEREVLVVKIGEKLSADAVKDLVAKAIDVRDGRVKPGDFYLALLSLSDQLKRQGVEIPTRELRNYVGYLKLSDSLRHDELMTEAEQLRARLLEKFAKDDRVWRLVTTDRRVALERLLWKQEMTPDQYAAFKQDGPLDWAEVEKYVAGQEGRVGVGSDSLAWTASLPQVRAYYELALERDVAMVKNALADMERTGAKRGVLIAGGFHTPGLTRFLRQSGAAYAVIQPNFEAGEPRNEEGDLAISQAPDAFTHTVREANLAVFNAKSPQPLEQELTAQTQIEFDLQSFIVKLFSGLSADFEKNRALLKENKDLVQANEVHLEITKVLSLKDNEGQPQVVLFGSYNGELFVVAGSLGANPTAEWIREDNLDQSEAINLNKKLKGLLESRGLGGAWTTFWGHLNDLAKARGSGAVARLRAEAIKAVESIPDSVNTPITPAGRQGAAIVDEFRGTVVPTATKSFGRKIQGAIGRTVANIKGWGPKARGAIVGFFLVLVLSLAQAAPLAIAQVGLTTLIPGSLLLAAGALAIWGIRRNFRPAATAPVAPSAEPADVMALRLPDAPAEARAPPVGLPFWLPIAISAAAYAGLYFVSLPILLETISGLIPLAAASALPALALPLKLAFFGVGFFSGVSLLLTGVAVGGRLVASGALARIPIVGKALTALQPFGNAVSNLPLVAQVSTRLSVTQAKLNKAGWKGKAVLWVVHFPADLWGVMYNFAFVKADRMFQIYLGQSVHGPLSFTEERFTGVVHWLTARNVRPELRGAALLLILPVLATIGLLGGRLKLLVYSTIGQTGLMFALSGLLALAAPVFGFDSFSVLSFIVNANIADIFGGAGWAFGFAQGHFVLWGIDFSDVVRAGVQFVSPFAMAGSLAVALVMTSVESAKGVQREAVKDFGPGARGFLNKWFGWMGFMPGLAKRRALMARMTAEQRQAIRQSFWKGVWKTGWGLQTVGIEVAIFMTAARWLGGPVFDVVSRIENPKDLSVLSASQHMMATLGVDTQNIAVPFTGKTVRQVHEYQTLKWDLDRTKARIVALRQERERAGGSTNERVPRELLWAEIHRSSIESELARMDVPGENALQTLARWASWLVSSVGMIKSANAETIPPSAPADSATPPLKLKLASELGKGGPESPRSPEKREPGARSSLPVQLAVATTLAFVPPAVPGAGPMALVVEQASRPTEKIIQPAPVKFPPDSDQTKGTAGKGEVMGPFDLLNYISNSKTTVTEIALKEVEIGRERTGLLRSFFADLFVGFRLAPGKLPHEFPDPIKKSPSGATSAGDSVASALFKTVSETKLSPKDLLALKSDWPPAAEIPSGTKLPDITDPTKLGQIRDGFVWGLVGFSLDVAGKVVVKIYDDHNGNGKVDPGERPIYTLPPSPFADQLFAKIKGLDATKQILDNTEVIFLDSKGAPKIMFDLLAQAGKGDLEAVAVLGYYSGRSLNGTPNADGTVTVKVLDELGNPVSIPERMGMEEYLRAQLAVALQPGVKLFLSGKEIVFKNRDGKEFTRMDLVKATTFVDAAGAEAAIILGYLAGGSLYVDSFEGGRVTLRILNADGTPASAPTTVDEDWYHRAMVAYSRTPGVRLFLEGDKIVFKNKDGQEFTRFDLVKEPQKATETSFLATLILGYYAGISIRAEMTEAGLVVRQYTDRNGDGKLTPGEEFATPRTVDLDDFMKKQAAFSELPGVKQLMSDVFFQQLLVQSNDPSRTERERSLAQGALGTMTAWSWLGRVDEKGAIQASPSNRNRETMGANDLALIQDFILNRPGFQKLIDPAAAPILRGLTPADLFAISGDASQSALLRSEAQRLLGLSSFFAFQSDRVIYNKAGQPTDMVLKLVIRDGGVRDFAREGERAMEIPMSQFVDANAAILTSADLKDLVNNTGKYQFSVQGQTVGLSRDNMLVSLFFVNYGTIASNPSFQQIFKLFNMPIDRDRDGKPDLNPGPVTPFDLLTLGDSKNPRVGPVNAIVTYLALNGEDLQKEMGKPIGAILADIARAVPEYEKYAPEAFKRDSALAEGDFFFLLYLEREAMARHTTIEDLLFEPRLRAELRLRYELYNSDQETAGEALKWANEILKLLAEKERIEQAMKVGDYLEDLRKVRQDIARLEGDRAEFRRQLADAKEKSAQGVENKETVRHFEKAIDATDGEILRLTGTARDAEFNIRKTFVGVGLPANARFERGKESLDSFYLAAGVDRYGDLQTQIVRAYAQMAKAQIADPHPTHVGLDAFVTLAGHFLNPAAGLFFVLGTTLYDPARKERSLAQMAYADRAEALARDMARNQAVDAVKVQEILRSYQEKTNRWGRHVKEMSARLEEMRTRAKQGLVSMNEVRELEVTLQGVMTYASELQREFERFVRESLKYVMPHPGAVLPEPTAGEMIGNVMGAALNPLKTLLSGLNKTEEIVARSAESALEGLGSDRVYGSLPEAVSAATGRSEILRAADAAVREAEKNLSALRKEGEPVVGLNFRYGNTVDPKGLHPQSWSRPFTEGVFSIGIGVDWQLRDPARTAKELAALAELDRAELARTKAAHDLDQSVASLLWRLKALRGSLPLFQDRIKNVEEQIAIQEIFLLSGKDTRLTLANLKDKKAVLSDYVGNLADAAIQVRTLESELRKLLPNFGDFKGDEDPLTFLAERRFDRYRVPTQAGPEKLTAEGETLLKELPVALARAREAVALAEARSDVPATVDRGLLDNMRNEIGRMEATLNDASRPLLQRLNDLSNSAFLLTVHNASLAPPLKWTTKEGVDLGRFVGDLDKALMGRYDANVDRRMALKEMEAEQLNAMAANKGEPLRLRLNFSKVLGQSNMSLPETIRGSALSLLATPIDNLLVEVGGLYSSTDFSESGFGKLLGKVIPGVGRYQAIQAKVKAHGLAVLRAWERANQAEGSLENLRQTALVQYALAKELRENLMRSASPKVALLSHPSVEDLDENAAIEEDRLLNQARMQEVDRSLFESKMSLLSLGMDPERLPKPKSDGKSRDLSLSAEELARNTPALRLMRLAERLAEAQQKFQEARMAIDGRVEIGARLDVNEKGKTIAPFLRVTLFNPKEAVPFAADAAVQRLETAKRDTQVAERAQIDRLENAFGRLVEARVKGAFENVLSDRLLPVELAVGAAARGPAEARAPRTFRDEIVRAMNAALLDLARAGGDIFTELGWKSGDVQVLTKLWSAGAERIPLISEERLRQALARQPDFSQRADVARWDPLIKANDLDRLGLWFQAVLPEATLNFERHFTGQIKTEAQFTLNLIGDGTKQKLAINQLEAEKLALQRAATLERLRLDWEQRSETFLLVLESLKNIDRRLNQELSQSLQERLEHYARGSSHSGTLTGQVSAVVRLMNERASAMVRLVGLYNGLARDLRTPDGVSLLPSLEELLRDVPAPTAPPPPPVPLADRLGFSKTPASWAVAADRLPQSRSPPPPLKDAVPQEVVSALPGFNGKGEETPVPPSQAEIPKELGWLAESVDRTLKRAGVDASSTRLMKVGHWTALFNNYFDAYQVPTARRIIVMRNVEEILPRLLRDLQDLTDPEDLPNMLGASLEPILNHLLPRFRDFQFVMDIGARADRNFLTKKVGLALAYAAELAEEVPGASNNPALRASWIDARLTRDLATLRGGLPDRRGGGQNKAAAEANRENIQRLSSLAETWSRNTLRYLPEKIRKEYEVVVRRSVAELFPHLVAGAALESVVADREVTQYGDLELEALYRSLMAQAVAKGQSPAQFERYLREVVGRVFLPEVQKMFPAQKAEDLVRDLAGLAESSRLRDLLRRLTGPDRPTGAERDSLMTQILIEAQEAKSIADLSTSLFWTDLFLRDMGIDPLRPLSSSDSARLRANFGEFMGKVRSLRDMPIVQKLIHRQQGLSANDSVNWYLPNTQGALSGLTLDWIREGWSYKEMEAHVANVLYASDHLKAELQAYAITQGETINVDPSQARNPIEAVRSWGLVSGYVRTVEKLNRSVLLKGETFAHTLRDMTFFTKALEGQSVRLNGEARRLDDMAAKESLGEKADAYRRLAKGLREQAAEFSRQSRRHDGYLYQLTHDLVLEQPFLLPTGVDHQKKLSEFVVKLGDAKARNLIAGARAVDQLFGYLEKPKTRPIWITEGEVRRMLGFILGVGGRPGLVDKPLDLRNAIYKVSQYLPSRGYTSARFMEETSNEILLQGFYMLGHRDKKGAPEPLQAGEIAPFLNNLNDHVMTFDEVGRLFLYHGVVKDRLAELPSRVVQEIEKASGQELSPSQKQAVAARLPIFSDTQLMGLATRFLTYQDGFRTMGRTPSEVQSYLEAWISDAAFVQSQVWESYKDEGGFFLPFVTLGAAVDIFRQGRDRLTDHQKTILTQRFRSLFKLDPSYRNLGLEANELRLLRATHYVVFGEEMAPDPAVEKMWVSRWIRLNELMKDRPAEERQIAQYELLVRFHALQNSLFSMVGPDIKLHPDVKNDPRWVAFRAAADALAEETAPFIIQQTSDWTSRQGKLVAFREKLNAEDAARLDTLNRLAEERTVRAKELKERLTRPEEEVRLRLTLAQRETLGSADQAFLISEMKSWGLSVDEVLVRYFTLPKLVAQAMAKGGWVMDLHDESQRALVSALAGDIFQRWGQILSQEDQKAVAERLSSADPSLRVAQTVRAGIDEELNRLTEQVRLASHTRTKAEAFGLTYSANPVRQEAAMTADVLRLAADAASGGELGAEHVDMLFGVAEAFGRAAGRLGANPSKQEILFRADQQLRYGIARLWEPKADDAFRARVEREVRPLLAWLFDRAPLQQDHEVAAATTESGFGRSVNRSWEENILESEFVKQRLPFLHRWFNKPAIRSWIEKPSLEKSIQDRLAGDPVFVTKFFQQLTETLIARRVEPAEIARKLERVREWREKLSAARADLAARGQFDRPGGDIALLTDLDLLLYIDETESDPRLKLGFRNMLFPALSPENAPNEAQAVLAAAEFHRFMDFVGRVVQESVRQTELARAEAMNWNPERPAWSRWLLGRTEPFSNPFGNFLTIGVAGAAFWTLVKVFFKRFHEPLSGKGIIQGKTAERWWSPNRFLPIRWTIVEFLMNTGTLFILTWILAGWNHMPLAFSIVNGGLFLLVLNLMNRIFFLLYVQLAARNSRSLILGGLGTVFWMVILNAFGVTAPLDFTVSSAATLGGFLLSGSVYSVPAWIVLFVLGLLFTINTQKFSEKTNSSRGVVENDELRKKLEADGVVDINPEEKADPKKLKTYLEEVEAVKKGEFVVELRPWYPGAGDGGTWEEAQEIVHEILSKAAYSLRCNPDPVFRVIVLANHPNFNVGKKTKQEYLDYLYQEAQAYFDEFTYTDKEGNVHRGSERLVLMVMPNIRKPMHMIMDRFFQYGEDGTAGRRFGEKEYEVKLNRAKEEIISFAQSIAGVTLNKGQAEALLNTDDAARFLPLFLPEGKWAEVLLVAQKARELAARQAVDAISNFKGLKNGPKDKVGGIAERLFASRFPSDRDKIEKRVLKVQEDYREQTIQALEHDLAPLIQDKHKRRELSIQLALVDQLDSEVTDTLLTSIGVDAGSREGFLRALAEVRVQVIDPVLLRPVRGEIAGQRFWVGSPHLAKAEAEKEVESFVAPPNFLAPYFEGIIRDKKSSGNSVGPVVPWAEAVKTPALAPLLPDSDRPGEPKVVQSTVIDDVNFIGPGGLIYMAGAVAKDTLLYQRESLSQALLDLVPTLREKEREASITSILNAKTDGDLLRVVRDLFEGKATESFWTFLRLARNIREQPGRYFRYQGKTGYYIPGHKNISPRTLWAYLGDLMHRALFGTIEGQAVTTGGMRQFGKSNGFVKDNVGAHSPRPGFPFGAYYSRTLLFSGLFAQWVGKAIARGEDLGQAEITGYLNTATTVFNSEDEINSDTPEDTAVLFSRFREEPNRYPGVTHPDFYESLPGLVDQARRSLVPPIADRSTALVLFGERAIIFDDRPLGVFFDIQRSWVGKWLTNNDTPQFFARFRGRFFSLGLHGRLTNNLMFRGMWSSPMFALMLFLGFIYTNLVPGLVEVEFVKSALMVGLVILGGLLSLKFVGPLMKAIENPLGARWTEKLDGAIDRWVGKGPPVLRSLLKWAVRLLGLPLAVLQMPIQIVLTVFEMAVSNAVYLPHIIVSFKGLFRGIISFYRIWRYGKAGEWPPNALETKSERIMNHIWSYGAATSLFGVLPILIVGLPFFQIDLVGRIVLGVGLGAFYGLSRLGLQKSTGRWRFVARPLKILRLGMDEFSEYRGSRDSLNKAKNGFPNQKILEDLNANVNDLDRIQLRANSDYRQALLARLKAEGKNALVPGLDLYHRFALEMDRQGLKGDPTQLLSSRGLNRFIRNAVRGARNRDLRDRVLVFKWARSGYNRYQAVGWGVFSVFIVGTAFSPFLATMIELSWFLWALIIIVSFTTAPFVAHFVSIHFKTLFAKEGKENPGLDTWRAIPILVFFLGLLPIFLAVAVHLAGAQPFLQPYLELIKRVPMSLASSIFSGDGAVGLFAGALNVGPMAVILHTLLLSGVVTVFILGLFSSLIHEGVIGWGAIKKRFRGRLEVAAKAYFDLLNKGEPLDVKNPPVAILLLGNPFLPSVTDLAAKWKEGFKNVPIVLAGGKGPGTPGLLAAVKKKFEVDEAKILSFLNEQSPEVYALLSRDSQSLTEADLMRFVLLKSDIPTSMIRQESTPSGTIEENFRNTQQILLDLVGEGRPNVGVVTGAPMRLRFGAVASNLESRLSLPYKPVMLNVGPIDLSILSDDELADLVQGRAGNNGGEVAWWGKALSREMTPEETNLKNDLEVARTKVLERLKMFKLLSLRSLPGRLLVVGIFALIALLHSSSPFAAPLTGVAATTFVLPILGSWVVGPVLLVLAAALLVRNKIALDKVSTLLKITWAGLLKVGRVGVALGALGIEKIMKSPAVVATVVIGLVGVVAAAAGVVGVGTMGSLGAGSSGVGASLPWLFAVAMVAVPTEAGTGVANFRWTLSPNLQSLSRTGGFLAVPPLMDEKKGDALVVDMRAGSLDLAVGKVLIERLKSIATRNMEDPDQSLHVEFVLGANPSEQDKAHVTEEFSKLAGDYGVSQETIGKITLGFVAGESGELKTRLANLSHFHINVIAPKSDEAMAFWSGIGVPLVVFTVKLLEDLLKVEVEIVYTGAAATAVAKLSEGSLKVDNGQVKLERIRTPLQMIGKEKETILLFNQQA